MKITRTLVTTKFEKEFEETSLHECIYPPHGNPLIGSAMCYRCEYNINQDGSGIIVICSNPKYLLADLIITPPELIVQPLL